MLATLSLEAPSTKPAADGGAASRGKAAGAGASAKFGKKEKEMAVLIYQNKGKRATVVRGLDDFGVKNCQTRPRWLPSALILPDWQYPQLSFSGVQEKVRERRHRVLECR